MKQIVSTTDVWTKPQIVRNITCFPARTRAGGHTNFIATLGNNLIIYMVLYALTQIQVLNSIHILKIMSTVLSPSFPLMTLCSSKFTKEEGLLPYLVWKVRFWKWEHWLSYCYIILLQSSHSAVFSELFCHVTVILFNTKVMTEWQNVLWLDEKKKCTQNMCKKCIIMKIYLYLQ